MRPEGFEPPLCRLKVCRAAVTPRPRVGGAVRLIRCRRIDESCVERLIVGIADFGLRNEFPESAIRNRQSAIEVARGGVEPPPPPYQSDMLPLHHRAVVIADFGLRIYDSTQSEIRNRQSAIPQYPVRDSNPRRRIESPASWPLEERGVFDCGFRIADFLSFNPQSEIPNPQFVEWAGRRSNPRLRFFRPPLHRLSYQPLV